MFNTNLFTVHAEGINLSNNLLSAKRRIGTQLFLFLERPQGAVVDITMISDIQMFIGITINVPYFGRSLIAKRIMKTSSIAKILYSKFWIIFSKV